MAGLETINKVHGWPWKLAAWSVKRIGKPFSWGETDCAILCLEAFDVMTGAHQAELYRARYRSLREAVKFQRDEVSLPDWLRSMGCFTVDRSELGDFIVVERDGFQCGHVCFGSKSLSTWIDAGVNACQTEDVLTFPSARILRVP